MDHAKKTDLSQSVRPLIEQEGGLTYMREGDLILSDQYIKGQRIVFDCDARYLHSTRFSIRITVEELTPSARTDS